MYCLHFEKVLTVNNTMLALKFNVTLICCFSSYKVHTVNTTMTALIIPASEGSVEIWETTMTVFVIVNIQVRKKFKGSVQQCVKTKIDVLRKEA